LTSPPGAVLLASIAAAVVGSSIIFLQRLSAAFPQ